MNCLRGSHSLGICGFGVGARMSDRAACGELRGPHPGVGGGRLASIFHDGPDRGLSAPVASMLV